MDYFIYFPFDSHYVTFVKIERHTRLSFPCLKIREICLELHNQPAKKLVGKGHNHLQKDGHHNLMNERNRIGPSTVLCGTPDSSCSQSIQSTYREAQNPRQNAINTSIL